MKKLILVLSIVAFGLSSSTVSAIVYSPLELLKIQDRAETYGTTQEQFNSSYNTLTRKGIGPDGRFTLPDAREFKEVGKNTSFRRFILNVLNFALTFTGIIAVAAVIYSGFLYLIAAGDQTKIDQAKKIDAYSVAGIVVILASFALVNTIIRNAGSGGNDREFTSGLSNSVDRLIRSGGTSINSNTFPWYNNGNLFGSSGNDNLFGGSGNDNLFDSKGVQFSVPTDALTSKFATRPWINPDNPNPSFGNAAPSSNTSLWYNNGNLLGGSGNSMITGGGGVTTSGFDSFVSTANAKKGILFGVPIKGKSYIDFGDGTFGKLDTLKNLSKTLIHTYGKKGTYTVRTITQTPNGEKIPTTRTLVVGGVTANFTIDKVQALVGETVTLDASTSSTTVGTLTGYNWTCSGSGCFPNVAGKVISVVFGAPGMHEITLSANNSTNITQTAKKSLQVLNGKPTASFTFQQDNTSNDPLAHILDASGSQNIFGGGTQLTYNWTVEGATTQTTNNTLNHTFASAGEKIVTLQVTQSFNGQTLTSNTVSKTVIVNSSLPAGFNITP